MLGDAALRLVPALLGSTGASVNWDSPFCSSPHAPHRSPSVRPYLFIAPLPLPHLPPTPTPPSNHLLLHLQGYARVPRYDVAAHREALFSRGPLAISLDASQASFAFYSSGVYREPAVRGGEGQGQDPTAGGR